MDHCKQCEKPIYAHGLCRSHYRAERRAIGLEPRYVSKVRCSAEGCGKTQESRGMCAMHAWRHDHNGDVNVTLRSPVPKHCSVSGCDKPMVSGSGKGLCPMHYQRKRQYGDINHVTARTDLLDRSAPCCIEGCDQSIGPMGNKGMCRTHARAAQRALRPAHYKGKLEARRHRVRVATPPWADLTAIEAFYAATPAGHEVAHAIPLRGVLVSGLHARDNLQYLPLVSNRRKGNRVV